MNAAKFDQNRRILRAQLHQNRVSSHDSLLETGALRALCAKQSDLKLLVHCWYREPEMNSARLQTTKTSAQDAANHAANLLASNPREVRLLRALALHSGLMLEQLDRAVGASNTPDLVLRLRRSWWDLPCVMVKLIDQDSFEIRAGRYSFSANDRTRYANATQKWKVLHDC